MVSHFLRTWALLALNSTLPGLILYVFQLLIKTDVWSFCHSFQSLCWLAAWMSMLTEGSYTYCVALNLKGLLDNIKIFTIFAFVFFLLRIVILIYPKYDYIVPPDAGMKCSQISRIWFWKMKVGVWMFSFDYFWPGWRGHNTLPLRGTARLFHDRNMATLSRTGRLMF